MIVEALCFAYLCMIAALVVTGVITGVHLLKAYLLLAFALALNWIADWKPVTWHFTQSSVPVASSSSSADIVTDCGRGSAVPST